MLHLSTMIILMVFIFLFLRFIFFKIVTPPDRAHSPSADVRVAVELRSSRRILHFIKLFTFNRVLSGIFIFVFWLLLFGIYF